MARKVLETVEAKRKKENRRIIAAAAPWFYVPNWNHLVVNDDYVRMLEVINYMSKESLNWGAPFIGLGGVNATISLIMRQKGAAETASQITKTANEANAWSIDQVNMTYMEQQKKDFESEQARAAANLMIRSNATMYESYLYIGVHARSLADLEKKTSSVEKTVDANHKTVSTFVANQDAMFWAASPFLMSDELSEEQNNWSMPATTISQGLFNREKGICDPIGIPLGDDYQQGLIRLDFLLRSILRPNSNIFIEGESGSGKSTIMKHILAYLYLLFDCKILINDVDGEFSKLVEWLGGLVVRLDTSKAMILSPFIPRNIGADGEDTLDDPSKPVTDDEIAQARKQALEAKVLSTHLPFLVTFLMKAFAIPAQSSRKSILYIACERAYHKYGVSDDMSFEQYHKSDLKWPTLKDVYEIIPTLKTELPESVHGDIDRLLLDLHRGVLGSDRHMWEDSREKMPDAPIVCINLEGLSADEDMMAAQYYNVLTWEWSQVRSHRYSEKHVVIASDEIHRSVNVKNIDAAYQYKDMVQRIRKYGALMMSATQMISEILVDPIRSAGQGIIYNSTYQFFGKTSGDLSLPGSNIREVQSLLGAPAEVMKELIQAPRGKFIVRVGSDQQSWLRVNKVEPWELEIFGKGGGK